MSFYSSEDSLAHYRSLTVIQSDSNEFLRFCSLYILTIIRYDRIISTYEYAYNGCMIIGISLILYRGQFMGKQYSVVRKKFVKYEVQFLKKDSKDNIIQPDIVDSISEYLIKERNNNIHQLYIMECNKQRKTPSSLKKRRRLHVGLVVLSEILITLVVLYITGVIFYKDHFFFGISINDIPCNGMTIEEAKNDLKNLYHYNIDLIDENHKVHRLNLEGIGTKCDLTGDINQYLDKQNPYLWMTSGITKRSYKTDTTIHYNRNDLVKCVNNLSIVKEKNMVEPKNPIAHFVQNKLVIEKEVLGNKINIPVLVECMSDAIDHGKSEIDLVKSDCYERPTYTVKSTQVQRLQRTFETLNETRITYLFGNQEEVLDVSTFGSFIQVSSEYVLTFDKEAVKNYVKWLAEKYDTIGCERSFHTTSGLDVKISGGNYGWSIDCEKEADELIQCLMLGESIRREPIYKTEGFCRDSDDIGTTYIEINLTKQHLYYYIDGIVVLETDIVSGNMAKGYKTPAMICYIAGKARNRTLRGEGYRSFVRYWMPIYGGIGIHDASWRGQFGGDIYKTKGSHGCINTPFYKVRELYSLVEIGTPVVCYYEE